MFAPPNEIVCPDVSIEPPGADAPPAALIEPETAVLFVATTETLPPAPFADVADALIVPGTLPLPARFRVMGDIINRLGNW